MTKIEEPLRHLHAGLAYCPACDPMRVQLQPIYEPTFQELEYRLKKMLKIKSPEIEKAWVDHILFGKSVPENLLEDKP